MPFVESELAWWRDPQLALLATSPCPAWLWRVDGSRMLWANAAGAALFGAPDVAHCLSLIFDRDSAVINEVIRVAASLPAGGAPRLERLRGFGSGFHPALACTCARTAINGVPAVLVTAAEPAGPELPLDERVRRLFGDDGPPVSVFTIDGEPLHATAAARAQLAGATSLAALGLEPVAAEALKTGNGSGPVRCGETIIAGHIDVLGSDAGRVLLLTLPLRDRDAPSPASETPSSAQPADPSDPHLAPVAPAAERRHPLRFVWQMDEAQRFVVGSDEFIALVGPRTTAAFGRQWREIADELKLDPQNQVARAVTSRETWSGVIVEWPIDESSDRLPVELSGLPVFDRERNFRGYRGFGVCRDISRINQLMRARRERPIDFMSVPEGDTGSTQRNPPAAHLLPATEKPSRLEREPAAPVATAANVVPFRTGPVPDGETPTLSPVERKAFSELAQELSARLNAPADAPTAAVTAVSSILDTSAAVRATKDKQQAGAAAAPPQTVLIESSFLDRLPLGLLVYREDALLHANRHFLELTGYGSLDALATAGGLGALFAEPGADAIAESAGPQALAIRTQSGEVRRADGRLLAVPWNGASALALVLAGRTDMERRRTADLALAEAHDRQQQTKQEAERALAALQSELEATRRSAEETGTELEQTRENAERDRQGFGRELEDTRRKLQDAETELRKATAEAQRATAAKSEFLARISHEIRTPLNAITGFAEVVMAERFGPIGNERYREYIKDIHGAGTYLAAMLNDLLDLNKIESGNLELVLANIGINDVISQCVSIMQPQANRARIIIRTSLTPALPVIVADERSLRQIVLNLLGHSIKLTGPGGQVIVSTARSDAGEIVVRVRDTGVGMSAKEIEAALAPFRQSATATGFGSGGPGLALSLTKALAEANGANFVIKSVPSAGTIAEVAFPADRIAPN